MAVWGCTDLPEAGHTTPPSVFRSVVGSKLPLLIYADVRNIDDSFLKVPRAMLGEHAD